MWSLRTGGIFTLLTRFCLIDSYKYESGIRQPDYQSPWIMLEANVEGNTSFTLTHGLGEIPALVDVQVKSINNPNKDFVFTGVGGCPRDDDLSEYFGGVIYLYNDVNVLVAAPNKNNGHAVGYSIYTGSAPFWTGQNSQKSLKALVRVRAWRITSLPLPDFSVTNVHMETKSDDPNDMYKEESHGLGEIPALVIARLKVEDKKGVRWYSDTVGANLVAVDQSMSEIRHVIQGFDHQSVRIWAATQGQIFKGDDGYVKSLTASKGELEVYAWKHSSVKPFLTSTLQLGPTVPGELMEHPFQWEKTLDDVFVRVWAQAESGTNAGFLFPGSGSAAYRDSNTAEPCSYGGLLYAHNVSAIRFWRPATDPNGAIICVSELMANGINQQASKNARVIIRVWSFSKQEQEDAQEIENTCTYTTLT